MTVRIGYVEVEGNGELVGKGTERTHARCQVSGCGSWGEAHSEETTWWKDRKRCHEHKKGQRGKRRDRRKVTVIVTRTQRRPTLVKMR